jgi:predicted dehydrogenase
MIGVGRQARAYNLPQFLRSAAAEVVAVCEVDSWRLNNAVEMVRQHTGPEAKPVATYRDFRELLDVEAIDAVMITNWGAHLIDIALWGADLERTGPVSVAETGVFPTNELWNAMQQFDIDYTYANGITMKVSSVPVDQAPSHYTRFIGTDGWVQAGFGDITASDPDVLQVPRGEDNIRLPYKDEKQDFIDCVKSRGRPIADAETGHRTTSIGLLGQIAAQLGTPLVWDPAREEFTDNAAAKRVSRSHFAIVVPRLSCLGAGIHTLPSPADQESTRYIRPLAAKGTMLQVQRTRLRPLCN